MSRRMVGLMVASIALIACAAVVYWFLSDPINPLSCGRLRAGMVEDEVERMLGRPADKKYHPWEIATVIPNRDADLEWEKLWIGGEWIIVVQLDRNSKVMAVSYFNTSMDDPATNTFSRSVWKWLGW